MPHIALTPAQIALLAAPPLLLITTRLMYKGMASRLGPSRGYLVGFLFYWTCWCLLLPLLTVGPEGLQAMFQAPDPLFGRPGWLGAALLAAPLLVTYLTMFPAEVRGASLRVIVVSILFALVNGTLEEVLWRGAYLTAFPDSWLLGVVYPSVGFGFWHLAPQAVFPYEGPGGPLAFALMPVALGLVWGWVAKSSGSIRWTVAAHILLDIAGVAGRALLGGL